MVWESEIAWSLPSTKAKCLLVNASIVGGLGDPEPREPVKVIIYVSTLLEPMSI